MKSVPSTIRHDGGVAAVVEAARGRKMAIRGLESIPIGFALKTDPVFADVPSLAPKSLRKNKIAEGVDNPSRYQLGCLY